MNISSKQRRFSFAQPSGRTRPAFRLVRSQAAAAGSEICRLAAPAVVALCADSARGSADPRRYLQLPAGARHLDAAARTPFVRAGRTVPAGADGADARMDRAQVDRTPAHKIHALNDQAAAIAPLLVVLQRMV